MPIGQMCGELTNKYSRSHQRWSWSQVWFIFGLCGSHLYVRYLSACSFKMPTYPERGNSAGVSVGMIGYSSPAKEPTIRWSQRVLRVRDGKKRWPFSTRWWPMKWHQTSRAPWLQKRGLGPVLFVHLDPWWHSHKASWDFTGKPTGPVPHGWMVKNHGTSLADVPWFSRKNHSIQNPSIVGFLHYNPIIITI